MKIKNSGFSLIEVMIAGAIGVAIFLYLNQSLVQVKRMQKRLEKNDDVKSVRRFLTNHLPHYRAWKNNPDDVPTGKNAIPLYYYPTPREDIKIMALPIDRFNEIWASKGRNVLSCPEDFAGCRVAAFNSHGALISPTQLEKEKSTQIFLAFIHIETPEDQISRSFVPSFKVRVEDKSRNKTTRTFAKIFHVNPSGSLIKGEGVLPQVDNEMVDSIARKDCMVMYQENFPSETSMGFDLCKKARSKKPAECFVNMRDDDDVKASIAMIVCNKASNHMARGCFHEAGKLETSQVNRAILCSAATSLEPIKCATEILQNEADPTDERIYKTCSRAQDTTPAKCFLGLREANKDLLQYAHFLCPHHKN